MKKETSFNDLVRNRLKDFIGEKHWSVSRFASRYVDLYAEIYSKMESPGTSTARKLIEDPNHVFTEKEASVLERMTGIQFVQLWLEEQHRLLIAKATQYADTSGNMDPESLVSWDIRRLSDNPSSLRAEDIKELINRYSRAETIKPLVLLTDNSELTLAIMDQASEDAEKLTVSQLDQYGEDIPVDIICCPVDDIPTSAYGGKAFRRSLEIMKSGVALKRNRHIVLIYESDKEDTNIILNQWSSAAFVFRFIFTPRLIEECTPSPVPEKEDYRSYCLNRMRTLPELFRQEILACKKFPECDSAEECAVIITQIYSEQKDFFITDSYYMKPLQKLVSSGLLPEEWLDDDYDRRSLLTAMAEYPQWLRNKEEELSKAGISAENDNLHQNAIEGLDTMWFALLNLGVNPSLDRKGWHTFFEEEYNKNLME